MLNIRPSLKLAFIGGGNTSAVGYVHFCAAHMDNKFQVVAGAFCRSAENNHETSQQWGIAPERTYLDWQEMVEKECDKVDAFVILTPTPHHLEVLQYLFSKQVPVICEKAMVCDPKEVEALLPFYSKEQFLAVTFNYSGYAMVRELKHLISQGRLGCIQKIHLEMPQEGFRRPPDIAGKSASPQAWRLQDSEVPTICLDLGVHLHHLSSFLLDEEPSTAIAEFSNHSQYPNIVDDVQMLLKYPSGIKGSMWMSKTAIGHRNGLQVRVYGDKGSAKWFQLNPDELELNYNDGRREILDRAGQCEYADQFRYNRMKPGHPTGFVEAFANLYSDIADNLFSYKNDTVQKSPYTFGLEHANAGLKLFSAARRSSISQKWESI
ncbi:gfo/Idh/MocA family oxidoreductase [Pseudoalteromonas citrea]|uniref:Gfo/Idh/MocA family oxidoreductase n=1 Tax=Pseudoalteromonas citrea TaxID=43655 RepID=A0A5S3XU05_9GAMM|nr:Gfo/Idh/MocA family oxidoreductase [Pseudoalteromonas citrea]TMP43474.1 gfo/Idh/MocA family oxidoreductase [Pseudoalteromonas citrea]TMP62127.1 gfo/Idh/MocA family oxidoreductase [Pseudoalteromonas citrea]